MPRIPRFAHNRRDGFLLVILLLAGTLISSLPRPESTRYVHDLFARVNGVFMNTFDWAFELNDLHRENIVLRRQVAELSLQVSQLKESDRQNERLRQLLNFEQQRRAEVLTGAEVIARGDGRLQFTVTILAGSSEGLKKNQAVVTADGLVGRIDRMPGPRTAVVSLLNDPANAVAAVVERSREMGIFQFVEGEGNLLYVLQTADIEVGDVVLSSGLGGVYPAGLVIGRIVATRNDPEEITMSVTVQLSASLDRLEEVFILR